MCKMDLIQTSKGKSLIGILIVLNTGLVSTTLLTAYAQQIENQFLLNSTSSNNSNTNDPIIMHIHPHISVTVDGKQIVIPKDIGISPFLWQDHSLDNFGMQAMPEMGMSGMAPLHTHDDSGIIHVESTINRDYTLGEFLNIWGDLSFENKLVNATVDGKPVTDYKNIILSDNQKIELSLK